MDSIIFETIDAAATREKAASWVRDLSPGTVIALTGPLGAGKTHFVQGIAQGLGISQPVTSPTFTLVNEYDHPTRPLIHIDLYRLENPNEVLALGWEDLMTPEGVTVVEWADKFPHLFPDGLWWVSLTPLSENHRRIEIRRANWLSHPPK